jgi:hypothetical protein
MISDWGKAGVMGRLIHTVLSISDQERGNDYGPSSQHSMRHFSVVFVKTKIFYGPFNFCVELCRNGEPSCCQEESSSQTVSQFINNQ